MKKILITGCAHCGTSILKSIIGHCENVYEYPYEIDKINSTMLQTANERNKDAVLIKYPRLMKIVSLNNINKLKQINNTSYKEYIIIIIIRNPYYVLSSLNKRYNYEKKFIDQNWKELQNIMSIFKYFRNNKNDNIHCIKYEELFENNYANLKVILDKICLEYTNKIFDNNRYINVITEDNINNIKIQPQNTEHTMYRTWQINQKFENMNSIDKIDLLDSQYEDIYNSELVKELNYKI